MNNCAKDCIENEKKCKVKNCKLWIDYKNDLNCSVIATHKHGNMTLKQIADRLGLSVVRIKQIQDKALQKLRKNSCLKY